MSAPVGGALAAGSRTRRVDVASLVLAVVLLVAGVGLLVDSSSIESPLGAGGLGPAAFPRAVAVILLVLGVLLGASALRGRDEPAPADGAVAAPDDDVESGAGPEVQIGEGRPAVLREDPRLRVGVFVAALVAHVLLLRTGGYVVAAAVLFLGVSLAFGAPRLLRSAVVGVVLALVIFYAFTIGLGLGLPDLGGR